MNNILNTNFLIFLKHFSDIRKYEKLTVNLKHGYESEAHMNIKMTIYHAKTKKFLRKLIYFLYFIISFLLIVETTFKLPSQKCYCLSCCSYSKYMYIFWKKFLYNFKNI